MNRTKDYYLLLLSYVLVEIRFLGVDGGLELAPRLADIFHGVPEALRLSWTSDREERVYMQIRAKAEVHGLSDLLDRWEVRALRRLEQEASELAVAANGTHPSDEKRDGTECINS